MNLRLTKENDQIIVHSEQYSKNQKISCSISRKDDYVVVEFNEAKFTISRRDIPRFVSLLQMAAE